MRGGFANIKKKAPAQCRRSNYLYCFNYEITLSIIPYFFASSAVMK